MKHVQVSNFSLPIPHQACISLTSPKYLWEGKAWRLRSFKSLVLPYLQLLFHLEVSNHPFPTNCRKSHGNRIRGKLLCSPWLPERSNQPSWASLAGKELRLHPWDVPSSRPFPGKHRHTALLWHCSCHLHAGMTETSRGSQGHKMLSLVFLHSHLDPNFDPQSFIQISKKVSSSNHFHR